MKASSGGVRRPRAAIRGSVSLLICNSDGGR